MDFLRAWKSTYPQEVFLNINLNTYAHAVTQQTSNVPKIMRVGMRYAFRTSLRIHDHFSLSQPYTILTAKVNKRTCPQRPRYHQFHRGITQSRPIQLVPPLCFRFDRD